MTFKELQVIIERANKEAEKAHADHMFIKKKLNNIREKAFGLNRDTGFYGICDMSFESFKKCMSEYTYSDQMIIAYHLLLHIGKLDNMIFDEEGEE